MPAAPEWRFRCARTRFALLKSCCHASRERDGPMRLDADPDAAAGREHGSFGDAALSRLDEAAARTSTALRAAARARRVAEMAVQSDRSKVAVSLHRKSLEARL